MKVLALPSLLSLVLLMASCITSKGWQTARRDSAGIAPDPATTNEAILQVYGARAWGWRGWFAIHAWIAAKRSGENAYTVYDVVSWRAKRGEPLVRIAHDIPDRYWYDAKPKLLVSHQGKGVDALIDAVDKAAKEYPWKNTYCVFPGPNSNTFIAWIGLQVPKLKLKLPFSAIGSGYAKKDPE